MFFKEISEEEMKRVLDNQSSPEEEARKKQEAIMALPADMVILETFEGKPPIRLLAEGEESTLPLVEVVQTSMRNGVVI